MSSTNTNTVTECMNNNILTSVEWSSTGIRPRVMLNTPSFSPSNSVKTIVLFETLGSSAVLS